MNSFNDVLDDICDKVNEELKHNNTVAHLLEYNINLWAETINFRQNINSNIFSKITTFSDDIYTEWKPKKQERKEYKSNLNNIIKTFIYQLPLRNKNMNSIRFIVFLGLIITSVSFVVYKLNQENTSIRNQRVSSSTSNNDYYLLPTPQKLILIVNDLKKDCLEKIKNQGNKIKPEDCDKLYRATKCLWMGIESELSQQFRNYSNYIAQTDQESEYDVYLVEIDLPEGIEGFEKDVDTLSRIDAFRELSELNDLPVKISPRLKVSVYENTNVYNR